MNFSWKSPKIESVLVSKLGSKQCDANKADIEVPLQEFKELIWLVTLLQVVLLGHHNVLHSDCQKINVFVAEEKRLRVQRLRPQQVWCCQQSDGVVTAQTTCQQCAGVVSAPGGASSVFYSSMTQRDYHLLAFAQGSKFWSTTLSKFWIEKPKNGVHFSS